MSIRKIATHLITLVLAWTSAAALAAIESREIRAAPNVGFVFLDSATGRMFTLNPGSERFFATAAYTVTERDGTSRTVDFAGASQARFSAKWRTFAFVASMPEYNRLVLVDADTLAQTVVDLPTWGAQVEIAEATGKAYVIGSHPVTQAPWLVPGTMSGTLTEVDLLSRASRISQVEGFAPRQLAVDAAGARAYVTGTVYMRTGEETPGFLRAFETGGLTSGEMVPLGRRPQAIELSSDGKRLFVLGHVDWVYEPQYAEINRTVRAALWVVDTSTLATRSIPLPQAQDLRMSNGIITGSMAQGGTPDTVYVNDRYEYRLVVVDVPSGTWTTVPTESFGNTIAYNRVDDSVYLTFPRTGNVGVFSAEGVRLDTVPMGSPLAFGDGGTSYNITFDAAGRAYIPNGRDEKITVLTPDPASAVVNMTDLWWNPAQAGWGVFVDQQGTTAFAALFVTEAGRAAWYVMPEGKRQRDGSFAGALFRTSGPASAAAANARAVGSMRITPEKGDGSVLAYDIDGRTVASPIERQRFSAAPRSCGWSVGGAKSARDKANFTSLWFDSKDPGWGLALSHQGDTVFGVLFTFGADNVATWATMSNGKRRADGSFGGDMHRIGAAGVEAIGAMSIGFTDTGAATLSYSMFGASVTRAIERQSFASLVTDCTSE